MQNSERNKLLEQENISHEKFNQNLYDNQNFQINFQWRLKRQTMYQENNDYLPRKKHLLF